MTIRPPIGDVSLRARAWSALWMLLAVIGGPQLIAPALGGDATDYVLPLPVTEEPLPLDAAQGAIPVSYNSVLQDVPTTTMQPDLEQRIAQLGSDVQRLQGGLDQLAIGEKQLQGGLQKLAANVRVGTLDPGIKIALFGTLRGEMLLSDVRPVIPAAPFFLSPDTGLDQNTVDVHAKSTALGMAVEGPQIGDYKTGGLVLIYFFGQQVFGNSTGVFFAQGFGELKSDVDRLAFGLQADVFNPVNPTVLNWAMYLCAGNTGFLRGQLRYERYFKPDTDIQWTVTAGLSNPAPTELITFETPTLVEDNGWPNVEGRLAVGLGEEYQDGLVTRRPVEVGVSGVVGEIRTTQLQGIQLVRIVDPVWGGGIDLQAEVPKTIGCRGELYTGQGLGTYAGAIDQMFDLATLNTMRSSGGWFEVYYYFNDCVHTHWGYAIDKPADSDVSLGQRSRNTAAWGNLIWDVTRNYQVGLEITRWTTDWVALPAQFILGDNQGMDYHLRLQYSF